MARSIHSERLFHPERHELFGEKLAQIASRIRPSDWIYRFSRGALFVVNAVRMNVHGCARVHLSSQYRSELSGGRWKRGDLNG